MSVRIKRQLIGTDGPRIQMLQINSMETPSFLANALYANTVVHVYDDGNRSEAVATQASVMKGRTKKAVNCNGLTKHTSPTFLRSRMPDGTSAQRYRETWSGGNSWTSLCKQIHSCKQLTTTRFLTTRLFWFWGFWESSGMIISYLAISKFSFIPWI